MAISSSALKLYLTLNSDLTNFLCIRPAVLVEQAFMSHAEDEEKLADPDFRQLMAEKIRDGIIDYLKLVKK